MFVLGLNSMANVMQQMLNFAMNSDHSKESDISKKLSR